MLMQFVFLLLIGGALGATIAYYFRARKGGGTVANAESGTLHVTGVSPRPDAPGEQYVTLSGSISGPTVFAHEVYGRFAWDTNQWPSIGEQIPVVYPSGKPDRWQLGHPGARPYFGSKQPRDPQ